MPYLKLRNKLPGYIFFAMVAFVIPMFAYIEPLFPTTGEFMMFFGTYSIVLVAFMQWRRKEHQKFLEERSQQNNKV
jgi:hypothetical protein